MSKRAKTSRLDNLLSLLGLGRRRNCKGCGTQKRRTFSVEPLEERALLSVCHWTGAVSLNWNDSGNWANACVPQNGDDVVFSGTGVATNNNIDWLTVHSLTFADTGFSISGNALNLSADYAQISLGEDVNAEIHANVCLGSDTCIGGDGEDSVLTISGVISSRSSDGIGLEDGGLGTLILSAANTYTCPTTILPDAVLKVANDNAIASSHGVCVDGTLDLNGHDVTVNGFSGQGLVTSSAERDVEFTVNISDLMWGNTYDGDIADGENSTVSVTLGGPYGVEWLRPMSYTGTTTLDGGSLWFDTSDPITLHDVLINSGSLCLFDGDCTADSVTLARGNITGTHTLTSTEGFTVESGTISANLAGNVGLTKIGPGTVTLSGVNTYTGATTVSEGTLSVSNVVVNNGTSNLGNATSAVVLGDATHKGTLSYSGNSTTFTRGLAVGAAGGELDVTASNQTLTVANGGVVAGGDFTVGGEGNVSISSVVSGGGSLTKTGSGTLTLSGTNTYTGDTSIEAGTLDVHGSSAIPTGANAGDLTVNGTLDLSSYTVVGRNLSGDGAITSTSGGVLAVQNDQSTTFSGTISNLVALSVAGNLTLSGSNNYTGGTTIEAGTLTMGSALALGDDQGTLIVDGGTLDLNDHDLTVGSVVLAAGAIGTVGRTGDDTLTADRFTVLSGDIYANLDGDAMLAKAGDGDVTLHGAADFTGLTTVHNGRLILGLDASDPVLTGAGANLRGGSIVLNYTDAGDDPAADILSLLTTGYAAGWASGQIHSTNATSQIGIGWSDDTSGHQVTVARAQYGDTDLDGVVDGADLTTFFSNYNGTNNAWYQGDFNYDTDVNGSDMTLLYGCYGQGLATTPEAMMIARVGSATTEANSVQFAVAFNEKVGGVGTGDFTATDTASGHATIGSVVPFNPDANGRSFLYFVTVDNVFGTGTLGLSLVDDDSITDANSCPLGGAGTGNGDFSDSTQNYTTASPFVWVGLGSNNNWATTGNWLDGVVAPLSGGESVRFTATQGSTESSPVLPTGTNSLKSIEFAAGGFTLTGSALTITDDITVDAGATSTTVSANIALGGSVSIAVAAGIELTIAGVVSDGAAAGNIEKLGDGRLTLSGVNTYTGTTTIDGGVLVATRTTALPGYATSGKIIVNAGAVGGYWDWISNHGWNSTEFGSLRTHATWTAGTSLAIDTTNGDYTYGDPMTDAGGTSIGLLKLGANTLTLSGSNSYTGVTTIQAGTLSLNSGGALAGGGDITFTGGTLQFASGNRLDYSARIKNSTSPVAINTNSQDVTFAGIDATNTAGLVKLGGGTLYLGEQNAYGGGTTISAGTLQIGSSSTDYAGSLGSGGVVIGDRATLAFDAENLTVSNTISGHGTIEQKGYTAILASDNPDFAGAVLIDTGSTLQVGNGGTTGSLGTATVYGYGADYGSGNGYRGYLAFNLDSGAPPVSNAITGHTHVQVVGGALVLTGDLSYSGGTEICAGATLLINDQVDFNVLYGGGIVNNGTLTFDRSDNLTVDNAHCSPGNLIQSGTGSITFSAGADLSSLVVESGSLTVSGPCYCAGVTLDGGALTLSGAATLNNITINDGTLTLGSSLGSNGVTMNDGIMHVVGTAVVQGSVISNGGTLDLASLSSYELVVNGGTLTLNGQTSCVGVTVDEGILDVNGSCYCADVTLGGGAVTISDAAFFGDVTVNGGTLTLGASLGSNGVTMNGGSMHVVSAATVQGKVTFNGGVFDLASLSSYELVVNGGTLSLPKLSSGTVTINAGTLTLNGETSCTSMTVNGGTLNVNAVVTVANPLTNTGTIVVAADVWIHDGSTYRWGRAASVSGTEVLITWHGLESAGGNYSVQMLEDGVWTTVATSTGALFVDSGLTQLTQYHLRVVSTNAGGGTWIYDGGPTETSGKSDESGWYFVSCNDGNTPSGLPADAMVYAGSAKGALLNHLSSTVNDGSVPTINATTGTFEIWRYWETMLYSYVDGERLPCAISSANHFTYYTVQIIQHKECLCGCTSGGSGSSSSSTNSTNSSPPAKDAAAGASDVAITSLDTAGGCASCGTASAAEIEYNSRATTSDSGYGFGWSDATELPSLLIGSNAVVAQFGSSQSTWFDLEQNGSYAARYGSQQTLTHNTTSQTFILTNADGTTYTFYDADQTQYPKGAFSESVSPGGEIVKVTGWANGKVSNLQYQNADEQPYEERVFAYYGYEANGYPDNVKSVTLRQFDSAGTPTSVRQMTYTYYVANESFGLPGDLKTVTTQENYGGNQESWQGDETYYFRYYTTEGHEHQLKRVLLPNAFAAAAASTYGSPIAHPENWTGDDQSSLIAAYTCYYYEYDDAGRVTKELVYGKSNEYSSDTSVQSHNPDGANNWDRRTIETHADGSTTTTYYNYLNEALLTDVYDTNGTTTTSDDTHSITWNRYDDDGRLVLTAEPSAFVAVDGVYYSESYADLVNYASQDSPYLNNTNGLFDVTVYYGQTSAGIGPTVAGGVAGRVYQTAVAQGEAATWLTPGSTNGPILQAQYDYFARWTSTATTYAAAVAAGDTIIYVVADQTSYTNGVGANEAIRGAVTTSYAYTWYNDSFQIREQRTTLPAVSTGLNGSGVAASTFSYYTEDGHLQWSADADGRFTRYEYDDLTGKLTATLADVDAGDGYSLPTFSLTGWPSSLPASGDGVSQQNDFTYDAVGRVTQSLGPAHYAVIDGYTTPQLVRSATWVIYGDSIQRTWTVQGYVLASDQTTGYIVGPVTIVNKDHVGRVTDQIQAKYVKNGNLDESLSDLRADISAFLTNGTNNPFPVASYTSWTTNNYAHTHLVATAVYYNIDSSWTTDRVTSQQFPNGVYAWLGDASDPDSLFLGDQSNYTLTTYGYEDCDTDTNTHYMGRMNRVLAADGTITRYIYDDRGNVVSTWMGKNDTDATDADPTGNHAAGNNMVLVSSSIYDASGNLTESRSHYGDNAGEYYATEYFYDWRNRLTDSRTAANLVTSYLYNNRNQIVNTTTFADTDQDYFVYTDGVITGTNPDVSERRGWVITLYDTLGRVYVSRNHVCEQSTDMVPGAEMDSLPTYYWYDASGRVIKTEVGQTGAFTKFAYDGLGRLVTTYTGYDTDEATADLYNATTGQATLDLTDDVIVEQTTTWYDAAGETVASAKYQRLPGSTAAGALDAADSYATASAVWYDGLGRTVETANYGHETPTDGTHYFFDGNSELIANADGVPTVAEAAPPAPFDAQHQSSLAGIDYQLALYQYDAAGRAYRAIDNTGHINETLYDDAGRTVLTIQNYVADGFTSDPVVGDSDAEVVAKLKETSTDEDITVKYDYDSAGRLVTMVAYNAKGIGGGVEQQATKYLYTSPINGAWQTAVVYPDSTDVLTQNAAGDWVFGTGSNTDHASTTYDRLGRTLTTTDQRGVEHTYVYDSAGRLSADEVTSLGTSGVVDAAVLAIVTAYDDVGRVRSVTSYDNATARATTDVVNQVEYIYDWWGNVLYEYQAHYGAVDEQTTPRIQYDYETAGGPDDGAAYVRLLDVVYPNGRVVEHQYGDVESTDIDQRIDAVMSRLELLNDPETGVLASYKYLGLGQIVEEDYVQSQTKLTYLDSSGNVTGLDRFGRVVDQLWEDYGATPDAAIDEYLYTYDRRGNVTTKTNPLKTDRSLNEAYTYDAVDRLREFDQAGEYDGNGVWHYEFVNDWMYDSVGNAIGWWGAYNSANEQTRISDSTVTPTYDAAGNMTTLSTGNTARYDAWNRLVQVSDGSGTIERYEYDGAGRKIQTFSDYANGVAGTTVDDYYQGQQVIETRENSAIQYQNIWSARYIDAMVCRDSYSGNELVSTERLYYMSDANYNVTGLVKQSSGTWQVAERYTYSPYGEVKYRDATTWAEVSSSANNNTTLYTGRTWDTLTNLYYYRARWYDPTLMRFINRDPMAADKNLYRYVGNNPLINTDPAGLFMWALYDVPASCWKCAIVAAALGVGSGVDTELVRQWLYGNGEQLEWNALGMDSFDPDRTMRQGEMDWAKKYANIQMNLQCGETRSGTLTVSPNLSDLNGRNAISSNKMINRYWFSSVCTWSVTKTCDSAGCCKTIVASVMCIFSARDHIEFSSEAPYLNGQGEWEHAFSNNAGVYISDRLVAACYPWAKSFDVVASSSEKETWSIPCGDSATK